MKREELLVKGRQISEKQQVIARETDRLVKSLVDLRISFSTIEGAKEGESLVSIGGGALLKADVKTSRVLIPVGASYLLEFSPEDAKKEMQKRIEVTEQAVTKLTTEQERLNSQLISLEMEFQKAQGKEDV
ncbi:prefoldin subunit alpha [Candidatus Micrarchaeota archaeon]|nr:prefoldin subunit alpha [Candidatus Micrarchaeota archaeon]